MLAVAHLIDDVAVGGINRVIEDQRNALNNKIDFSTLIVNSRRPLPPPIPHDLAIVHFSVSWSKLPFLTLLRAQRGSRPILVIEHTYTRSFERNCVPYPERFRAMLRMAYRLADKVVAVSHAQAEWMLSSGLLRPEKLVVIQPSVNCETLFDIPIANKQPATALRLVAYGRYHQQKGFETAIDAMRTLPVDMASLTLAGYGPDKRALEERAAQLSNITVGAAVDNLPRLLAEHDVVVVPSRWEAFGLVCLEARAAGRPVIVTEVDGLTEQVQLAFGRCVAPDEPSAFAAAIREAADWDLVAMGQQARTSALGHNDRFTEANFRLWYDLASPAAASLLTSRQSRQASVAKGS
jgi:glycosyltransferase involved in cell wall biosynthesis